LLDIIRSLEEQGVRAYMPLPDWDIRSRHFGKQDFVYDPERDAYTCPGGTSLPFVCPDRPDRLLLYQADATSCNACALKARCTTSANGRLISRNHDEEYLDRVRGYRATEPYQKALRKRSVWVEFLFGEAQDWHGLRRFRLRRLWRVHCEPLRLAAGQNLKRLLSRRGWGRRPFPGGAPGLVVVSQRSAYA
jgi:transposase